MRTLAGVCLGFALVGASVGQSAPVAPQAPTGFHEQEPLKFDDQTEYEIVAHGGVMMHLINGHLMALLVDDDPDSSNNKAGKIGIQLEGTPAKVQVRNVWIKTMPAPGPGAR